MSNLKRWVQVGQGQFHKWEIDGDSLEGIWRGQHDGQFGPLGTLDTEHNGRVSFPLHTALLSRMERVKEGAEVRIIYVGKQRSKGGREFKAFEVYTASMDDILPAGAESGGDEVPF